MDFESSNWITRCDEDEFSCYVRYVVNFDQKFMVGFGFVGTLMVPLACACWAEHFGWGLFFGIVAALGAFMACATYIDLRHFLKVTLPDLCQQRRSWRASQPKGKDDN
jgi:dipeptide/tripeptide permease